MTTIATFTKTETGYIGEIHTLALKSKLTLSPADNTKGKAPDFRVIAEDGIEIGGAWKRKSKSGNAYLGPPRRPELHRSSLRQPYRA